MAEPTNTPMPTAPPTPRSTSPALGATRPGNTLSPPKHIGIPTLTSLPVLGGPTGSKPVVLHIGDPVKYNPETYTEFAGQFEVVRPSVDERQRPAFIKALREKRWGDFSAIFRPFWGTGGEMGNWDAELISLLPDSVRVFASAGTGFDWADTQLLGEKGIVYCNGGLAAAEAVSDFALAMIISTFRVLPYCISSATTADNFQTCHASATAQSHNLRGRVLGLVGLGNIGQQIALKCSAAFGMDIVYYDVERKPPALETRLRARYANTLEQLARQSDCVVLCAPGGAGQIINSESLRWFRPGARLVNVARGSLVDDEAVADALEQGWLSNAALDVHATEPNVHPKLLALAGTKALLTCHNAGGTVETHIGFEELAMRNIMAVLAGGQAITPVNTRWLSGNATT
ncbi:C-terminal-binding protein [Daldinia childiae]|uniref:C-terminal-binding protein n=1 Tax=Daldinia childiae TaxID=326645 RepID=UPI00144855B9|nr:C-terminal-binding protein [Daldinia childiae]KAF3063900.1 C-terminal-binding protein [Daldinia childiae]